MSKHKVAVTVLVIVCAIVIGDGYRVSRRAQRSKSMLRAAVAELTVQQLAAAIQECDAPRERDKPPLHDAAYCEEVGRRLDAEPLQITDPIEPKERM